MNSAVSIEKMLCAVDGRALLHIDALHIAQGERIAIVGPNGAGKSTLLRLLSGLMRAEHGKISVLGHALNTDLSPRDWRALRCQQGQIMQGLHLVGRLSALENVLIGGLGRLRGSQAWRGWLRCYSAADHCRAREALHAVGMLARAATRADKLSGGERQKIAIARLLMQGPGLILADEPTAALDPAAAADVCALLARAAEHATLISVLHNPALLPLLADRVIGLAQGRIAFDLPVAAVSDERLMQLYRAPAHAAQSIVGQALQHA